jgi:DNA-binding XRE family transcriptional regulator
MLNLFRGGQLDGMVYETKTLITSINLSVQGYTWTPEVVVSEKTGAKARVWIFGPQDSQQDGPAEEGTDAGPSSDVRPEGGHQMADVSLEERRKNLKLSRQQLADEAGLTPAKVYRIERGGGRTTEEETQGLADVLTKLEGADPS